MSPKGKTAWRRPPSSWVPNGRESRTVREIHDSACGQLETNAGAVFELITGIGRLPESRTEDPRS